MSENVCMYTREEIHSIVVITTSGDEDSRS